MSGGHVWALILAAGEGSRLRSLTTTTEGLTVPKQFCSLHGGASLLQETLARAAAVAQPRRVLTVVARQHRRWWQAPLCALPRANVIVQPANKGTAAGLLLPLLHLLQRDPQATAVVLPSDHFVRDETELACSLQRATRLARLDPQHVYLLGLVPEQLDTELGYIVPAGSTVGAVAPVHRFVEKPARALARRLIDGGGLLNMFIIAASARALLALYANRYSSLVARMTDAVGQDRRRTSNAPAARQLYATLPPLDFSRDVLQGQESALRVLTVPCCGWNDLGTPQRVAETLDRYRQQHQPIHCVPHTAHLTLAVQHARQQSALCSSAT